MGANLTDQAFRTGFARDAMIPRIDVDDKIDARLAKLPIENALAKLPIDPMDSAEPTHPIDRTEFFEPMDRREFSERTLQRDEVDMPTASHCVPSWPRLGNALGLDR